MIAVLTGDIVFSTSEKDSREWSGELKSVFRELEKKYELLGKGAEMHRGDGFQLGLPSASEALEIALLIRAGLRKSTRSKKATDARIAIGLGDYDLLQDSVNESDGEAFRKSGHTLDAIKHESVRLALASPDADFDGEMRVSLKLADVLIQNWSKADAETAWYVWAQGLTQTQIAEKLQISQPAVSKRFNRAYIQELDLLKERFAARVKKIS